MKHLTPHLKGLYAKVVLGPLFKLFEAVMELFVPLVMATIIDEGIARGDTTYILQRGGLLVLLAVLCAAFGLTCQYFAAGAASVFGARLRAALYKHVLRFSAQESDAYGSGSLITHLTNDVNQIQVGLNMGIRLATRVPFLIVGSIIMAFTVNARIALVFLLSTPVIVAILYFITVKTLPGYGEIQGGQDTLSRLGRENLEGTRVIRAFSRQESEKQQFDKASDMLSALIVRVGKISAALNPLTTFVVNLAIIAIVWFGAKSADVGTMEMGGIIALVSYMNQTLLALLVAANLVVLFTRAGASIRRVNKVFDTAPGITDGPGAEPDETAPAIEFRNVGFAYHEGADSALEDISFTLANGETLGVIGGTGSGKSTLARLIQRDYDVNEGTVQCAGHDVRSYTLGTLRARLGMVPQTAALFNGSIRHNLLVANPAASDDELWQALEIAQAADFVREKPEGLDTLITEGGKNLSGGQRQRLTIARALARKPKVLILDDSASALDYATDAALRGALRRESGKGSSFATILISQRAASIKHADAILVLDDGRMAGLGTHDELLQTNGVYREICASQGLLQTEGEVG